MANNPGHMSENPAVELARDDIEYDDKGGCDRPNLECLICNHEACGWCPDCSPGVPEWD
jgi:hypothetical protein